MLFKDNLLFYYIYVIMPPAKSAYNTCTFNGNKLICFKHVLTSDEYYFLYVSVHV